MRSAGFRQMQFACGADKSAPYKGHLFLLFTFYEIEVFLI